MSYKIPLFALNFDHEEEEAVIDVLQSAWISTGPKTAEFENIFASMLKIKHALALSNCTASLHLAMRLLNIGEGDEVICPSLTFVATANAIRYVKGIPIFAEIKSMEDLTLDPLDIERKITKKTKAIIVMHYGGFSCDMDSIMKIANKYGLKVIEDACHGPLSDYKGKKLGTIGDIGCFSFFSNKNISTGEGGMLVTNNTELFRRAKLHRSHGMTSMSYDRAKGHSTVYDVIELGYNYRLDDIRASIGIVQLRKLEKDLQARAKIRNRYISLLDSIEEIIIPFKDYIGFSSNYIFPVILKNSNSENRDAIRNQLSEKGIQTSVHYPAVHRFSIYESFYKELPKSDYAAENLITLPMYSKLGHEDIVFIAQSLKEVLDE